MAYYSLEDVTMSLGKRLRDVRTVHALSPEDLAKMSRVSNRTIRLLEKGQEKVKAEVIVRLAVSLREDVVEWLRLGGYDLDPAVISKLQTAAQERQTSSTDETEIISRDPLVSFILPSNKRVDVKLYTNGGIRVTHQEETREDLDSAHKTERLEAEGRVSFTLECNLRVKVQVYTNGRIEVYPF